MILHERGDKGWFLKDHLLRKNPAGVSGMDILAEHGVGWRTGAIGDVGICIDMGSSNPEGEILYTLEPPLVCPSIYLQEYHRPYLARFVNIDMREDHLSRFCGYQEPMTYKAHYCCLFDYETDWKSKPKFMATFASLLSVESEFSDIGLYQIRPPMITEAAKRYGDRFDFFGRVHDGVVPNYRGAILDERRYDYGKMDLLAGYKFALCFENVRVPGHAEKLYHALTSRTIPVYAGCPNVEEYIPKNLFIDVFDFPTFSDCLDFVDSLTEGEIADRIAMIDAFMRDPVASHKISSLFLAEEILKFIKDMNGEA